MEKRKFLTIPGLELRPVCHLALSRSLYRLRYCGRRVYASNKQTPCPESASELYRPNDRRLSTKLEPTFADRRCHVVSVTYFYGRILGFLDRSRYFFFEVAPQRLSDPRSGPTTSQEIWSNPDLWICSQELWPLDHRGGQNLCFSAPSCWWMWLVTFFCLLMSLYVCLLVPFSFHIVNIVDNCLPYFGKVYFCCYCIAAVVLEDYRLAVEGRFRFPRRTMRTRGHPCHTGQSAGLRQSAIRGPPRWCLGLGWG
jgi:hypothetical protein